MSILISVELNLAHNLRPKLAKTTTKLLKKVKKTCNPVAFQIRAFLCFLEGREGGYSANQGENQLWEVLEREVCLTLHDTVLMWWHKKVYKI